MVRDDLSKVLALCDEELEDTYFNIKDWTNIKTMASSINYFLFVALLIPVICIAICTSILKSIRSTVHSKIVSPKNHANVVALLLCSIFLSYYIICCDICAVHYSYFSKHELHDHDQHTLKYSFNFVVTIVILVIDGTTVLSSHMLLLCGIFCSSSNNKCQKCMLCCCSCIPFCAVFGCSKDICILFDINSEDRGTPAGINERTPTAVENGGTLNAGENGGRCSIYSCIMSCSILWFMFCPTPCIRCCSIYSAKRDSDKRVINNRLLWIMMFSLFGPFVCITSHASFILISWLTDPAQATSIALVYLAIFLFYFITLRQCYISNYNINNEIKRDELTKTNWYIELVTVTSYNHKAEGKEGAERKKPVLDEDVEKPFKKVAFWMAWTWGWVASIIIIFTILGFVELPLSTFDLPNYLLNLLQVFVVVLSVLVTYRILSTSEPEVLRFLSNFRAAFTRKLPKNRQDSFLDKINHYGDYDDIEAIGDLMGELALRIQKNPLNAPVQAFQN